MSVGVTRVATPLQNSLSVSRGVFFYWTAKKKTTSRFLSSFLFFLPSGVRTLSPFQGELRDRQALTNFHLLGRGWLGFTVFSVFFSGFNCVFMFFYCALLCYKVFFLVSLYSARFWKKIYGFFRILLGFTGLYQFRIDLTSTYRASISSTEFHLTFIDLNVVFYILMGFIGLLRAYELEDWTGSCLVSRYYLCFLMTASL